MLTFFVAYLVAGTLLSAWMTRVFLNAIEQRQIWSPCRCCNPFTSVALWWIQNLGKLIVISMVVGPVCFTWGLLQAVYQNRR